MCLKLGIGCKIGKSDMTLTFRQLGIRKLDWCLLVMKAKDPKTGKTFFFVDKCLPFGAAISCAHFQEFSNAIAAIMRFRTQEELLNYLDNYLFAAVIKSWCDDQIRIFMAICHEINFPILLEKTMWGTTLLTFLGFLIDTLNRLVLIPVDKLCKARELIQEILSKLTKKMTVKQMQKVCGFLNFLCRCVVPGRKFTRHLYTYTSCKKLRPHHHIRINSEIRCDLEMWLQFLEHPLAYCHSFIDFDGYWNAQDICMYSDVSKNASLGFRGTCMNSWVWGQWDSDFIRYADPSIEYLKLFAVLVVVFNWLHRFANKQIVLFCDNQAVMGMINKTTSSCKNCLVLIRILVLHSLKLNTRVFARYVPSKENKVSDYLLCKKFNKFWDLNLNWDCLPTPIPDCIWPISKIWLS